MFAVNNLTGITSAALMVGSNGDLHGPWPQETLDALAEHTSVSELQLLLNSRSDYDYTNDTFSYLNVLTKLKHLHLRFLVSQTPKKGTWPVLFADDMSAEQLESLTVESSTMPPLALSVSTYVCCTLTAAAAVTGRFCTAATFSKFNAD
jgi:hypothetical protein